MSLTDAESLYLNFIYT